MDPVVVQDTVQRLAQDVILWMVIVILIGVGWTMISSIWRVCAGKKAKKRLHGW